MMLLSLIGGGEGFALWSLFGFGAGDEAAKAASPKVNK